MSLFVLILIQIMSAHEIPIYSSKIHFSINIFLVYIFNAVFSFPFLKVIELITNE